MTEDSKEDMSRRDKTLIMWIVYGLIILATVLACVTDTIRFLK